MNAIRFEPTIGAEFSIDRRQNAAGGDLFADMLGEHLKQRAQTEETDVAPARRRVSERRHDADAQPQGRPIRPVIKHPTTLRGEAERIGEEQPLLPARSETCACAIEGVEDGRPSDAEPAVRINPSPEREAEPEAAAVAGEPELPAVPQPAATIVMTDGTVEDSAITPEIASAPSAVESIESEEPSPEPTEQPGVADQAMESSGAAPEAQDAAPSVASFAAALAAGLDGAATASLGGGDTMDAVPGVPPALPSAGLTGLTATAQTGQTGTDAEAEAAEDSAGLALKIAPEAPRSAEPAKPRPARSAAATEIRPQLPNAAPTPQPTPPAQPTPPIQGAPAAGLGEENGLALGQGFDGDGPALPGWTLHLAQGAAARRPDFVAQLRQHLQDLPAHEQVAVNIQRALREGAGRVSIQLSPAELGQIHVRLEIDEEKHVTAAVTVEKPGTLELLQRDARALERALHDAGLKMDRNDLSFSLGRQDGKGFAGDTGQSGRSIRGDGLADAQAEAESPASQAALVDTASGLVNVQI